MNLPIARYLFGSSGLSCVGLLLLFSQVLAQSTFGLSNRVCVNVSNFFQAEKLSPAELVQVFNNLNQVEFLADKPISCVKFFDFGFDDENRALITAFAQSESVTEVMLAVPSFQFLQPGVTNFTDIATIIGDIVQASPDTEFTLALGEEVTFNAVAAPELDTLLLALQDNAFTRDLPLTSPLGVGVLTRTEPPQDARFTEIFLESFSSLLSTLDFYSINAFPANNINGGIIQDEGLPTLQTTVAAFDAALAAFFGEEGRTKDIVLAGTGWPTAGGEKANFDNYEKFYTDLLAFFEGNETTLGNRVYMFELVDESLKPGAAIEQHYGFALEDGSIKVRPEIEQDSDSSDEELALVAIPVFFLGVLLVLQRIRQKRLSKELKDLEEAVDNLDVIDFSAAGDKGVANFGSPAPSNPNHSLYVPDETDPDQEAAEFTLDPSPAVLPKSPSGHKVTVEDTEF